MQRQSFIQYDSNRGSAAAANREDTRPWRVVVNPQIERERRRNQVTRRARRLSRAVRGCLRHSGHRAGGPDHHERRVKRPIQAAERAIWANSEPAIAQIHGTGQHRKSFPSGQDRAGSAKVGHGISAGRPTARAVHPASRRNHAVCRRAAIKVCAAGQLARTAEKEG